MDPRSRSAFLASFNRCRAAAGFLEDFYRRFIASSEEIRAKFAGTNMNRQVQMLEDSLYVVAVAIQGEEGSLARGDLPRIAARHSRKDLDIRPGLYDLWLECLIEAVRSGQRTIDIDNVNRVLMQPHWQKEVDLVDF